MDVLATAHQYYNCLYNYGMLYFSTLDKNVLAVKLLFGEGSLPLNLIMLNLDFLYCFC